MLGASILTDNLIDFNIGEIRDFILYNVRDLLL